MAARPKNRWPELCEAVAEDDGLPVRASGRWAEDKLHFWNGYIDITTRAMFGSPKWPGGLIYVDLFAGPGVCRLKESGKRIPGSPLIAARAPKPFQRILLCENNPRNASACAQRLAATSANDSFQVFVGDCNNVIGELLREIPSNALTLAFVDPTGLHANMETIQQLSTRGRVDMLVLFPDAVDVVRNVEDTYFPNSDTNLDRVFGAECGWREAWREFCAFEGHHKRRWFAEFYQTQLKMRAGYRHFGQEIIYGERGPLYRLVYATKHPLGLEFWDKISKRESTGQRRMF